MGNLHQGKRRSKSPRFRGNVNATLPSKSDHNDIMSAQSQNILLLGSVNLEEQKKVGLAHIEDTKEKFKKIISKDQIVIKRQRVDLITELLKSKLLNEEIVKEIGKSPLNIDRISDTGEVNEKCQKNPFMKKMGVTTKIALETIQSLSLDEKENNFQPLVCIQVFADETFCGGGLIKKWLSQEESTVRDLNIHFLASMINFKLVNTEMIGKDKSDMRFKYDWEKMSTSEGYMALTELCFTNLEPLEHPEPIFLLFSSLPCLTDRSESFDLYGTVTWLRRFRASKDKSINIHLTTKFIDNFYTLKKTKKYELDKLDTDYFRRVMIVIMFSDKYEIPGENDDLKKIVKKLVSLAKDGCETYLEAEANYKNSIRKQMRIWINFTRRRGVKYFIGGPIGCGAFKNDPKIVAEILAEEFIKSGGEMTFIYAAYEHDTHLSVFEEAFNKAYENLCK